MKNNIILNNGKNYKKINLNINLNNNRLQTQEANNVHMNSNYINSAFSGTNSYKDSNSNLKYNDENNNRINNNIKV